MATAFHLYKSNLRDETLEIRLNILGKLSLLNDSTSSLKLQTLSRELFDHDAKLLQEVARIDWKQSYAMQTFGFPNNNDAAYKVFIKKLSQF